MGHQFLSKHLPMVLYCIVGFGLLLQGIRYLAAEQIMPYHLDVIGTSWRSLNPETQTLLVGLLKGFGAGSLCVGLSVILLTLMPFRTGTNWARWAIPAIAGSYSGLLLYVTNLALLPGAVPITVSAMVLGVVIVAMLSSIVGGRIMRIDTNKK